MTQIRKDDQSPSNRDHVLRRDGKFKHGSEEDIVIERLPKREREIAEIVHALGEASAEDVCRSLIAPMSNAAVRSMLGRIGAKGIVRRRKAGKKYLYRIAEPDRATRESALRRLSADYFGGSLADAAGLLSDMVAREGVARHRLPSTDT